MKTKLLHLVYCPFVGLGLYGGWRGNRWLKNRIKIFKQFVVPSLLAQSNQDFWLWVSWIPEVRDNPIVKEFVKYLETSGIKAIHTYYGVCFWDDKYPDEVAHERLITSIHNSVIEITNIPGEYSHILMTIQPSDDCYRNDMVETVQRVLSQEGPQVFCYRKGLIMRYQTGEVAEYNPLTIPPFFTIKFKYSDFMDPFRHMKYTGPYKSHEYIADKLVPFESGERGFLVGTHGENISTVFDHPFKGEEVPKGLLQYFGLDKAGLLQMDIGWRKKVLRRLPYPVQRKIRYVFGEKGWNIIYKFLRQ